MSRLSLFRLNKVVSLIVLLICMKGRLTTSNLQHKNVSETKTNQTTITSTILTTPASILSLTTEKAKNVSDKSFVLLKNWHCGAYDFDKSLSHQMAEEDCPTRMC